MLGLTPPDSRTPERCQALKRRNVVVASLVSLATVLGLAVRVFRLDTPALWLDELTTLLYAAEPWHRITGELRTLDVHPPYYYMMQKAWNEALGDSPFQARLLPVLLGTACIPVLFMLGRRLIGTREGLIAAFLLTTAPLHVYYSRELRMYSLLCLSVLVALTGLAYSYPRRSATTPKRTVGGLSRFLAWAAYAGGSISAFYAHNTALLLPALTALWALAVWIRGGQSKRWGLEFAISTLAILLGMLPWAANLTSHVHGSLADFWIAPPSFSWVRTQVLGMFPYERWLRIVFFVLGGWGMWLLARKRMSDASLLGGLVIGHPVMLWLISYFRPVMVVRAMTWSAMLFTLFPAVVIARLPAFGMAAATAALIVVQGAALKPHYPAVVQVGDTVSFRAPLAEFDASSDVLVLFHVNLEHELRREVPEVFLGQVIAVTYGDKAPLLGALYKARYIKRLELAGVVQHARRVWLIEELSPLYPIKLEDDVEHAFDGIRSTGRMAGSWRSGNLSLTLVDRTQ